MSTPQDPHQVELLSRRASELTPFIDEIARTGASRRLAQFVQAVQSKVGAFRQQNPDPASRAAADLIDQAFAAAAEAAGELGAAVGRLKAQSDNGLKKK